MKIKYKKYTISLTRTEGYWRNIKWNWRTFYKGSTHKGSYLIGCKYSKTLGIEYIQALGFVLRWTYHPDALRDIEIAQLVNQYINSRPSLSGTAPSTYVAKYVEFLKENNTMDPLKKGNPEIKVVRRDYNPNRQSF